MTRRASHDELWLAGSGLQLEKGPVRSDEIGVLMSSVKICEPGK